MNIIEKLGITPGPWYDFISPEQHRCWVGTKANEPYYVAEIIGIERSMEKLEANTKLIAVTPEMLEDGLFNCELMQKIKESIYEPDKIHIYLERMKTGSYEKATGKDIKELLQ